MILIDKIFLDVRSSAFDPIKDKLKALRNKLDGIGKGNTEQAHLASSQEVDALYDIYDSLHEGYDTTWDRIDDLYMSAMEDFAKRSRYRYGNGIPNSSNKGIWSDGTGFFDSSSFGTRSSITRSIPIGPATPSRKPREEEIIAKISKHARKDWRLALLDILFVNELCAIFDHSNKGIDEVDADVLIEACALVGAPVCKFPLEEMELGDAVSLRNITMNDGISRSLINDEEEWENVREHARELTEYSTQIDDLCRIWAYASHKFCGTEHLVPVSKLGDLIESRGDKSFGNMDELAKATGADVLLDAYFSGVPADDIIA